MNHFNIQTMDKDAYNKVSAIHEEIEKEKSSEFPDNEKLIKLYNRELNESMFLGGIYTRNYGMYRPY